MRFLKEYIRKKLIEWFDLPESVVFEHLDGKVEKLTFDDSLIIVFTDKHYPLNQIDLNTRISNIIYMPSESKLEKFSISDLKNIKKEINMKIDMLLIRNV